MADDHVCPRVQVEECVSLVQPSGFYGTAAPGGNPGYPAAFIGVTSPVSPGITWDHLGLHENCLTFHCCLPFDPLPKLAFCHYRRKNKLQQTNVPNVPDTHLKVAGR